MLTQLVNVITGRVFETFFEVAHGQKSNRFEQKPL